MSRWELNYGIGSLQTYKATFKAVAETIEEYIHCEVMEWTQTNKFGKPVEIRVRQIRNLQEYFTGKRLAGHERLLEVDAIDPVHFRND